MMAVTSDSAYAHYADCCVGHTGFLSRPGHWSETRALDVLRGVLGHDSSTMGTIEDAVVAWSRRDVPELRSATDRVTPAELYGRIAAGGVGESMFLSGPAGARQMGYGAELAMVDEWRIERFVGLGCPWGDGLPATDDRVVDLGSGAGVDLAIASAAVGSGGAAIGIDRLPDLAAARRAGAHRTVLCDVTACAVRSNWATLVVANGLPPLLGPRSAPPVLSEVHRLLVPGGTFRFTTLVVGPDKSVDQLSDVDVVDAVRCSKPLSVQYRTLLEAAGFSDVRLQELPSPFVPGYRPGPVHAVLLAARRD